MAEKTTASMTGIAHVYHQQQQQQQKPKVPTRHHRTQTVDYTAMGSPVLNNKEEVETKDTKEVDETMAIIDSGKFPYDNKFNNFKFLYRRYQITIKIRKDPEGTDIFICKMYSNIYRKTIVPTNDLAPGWIKVLDEETGRCYFVNTITKEATWSRYLYSQFEFYT